MLLALLLGLAMLCSWPAHPEKNPKAPERTLLVLGDSLSAGFGLAAKEGWVWLLQQRVGARGWRVVNASISGETSAGGRSRISAELQRHKPALVIVALGANDGLRGLPVETAQANLAFILKACKQASAKVLLVGMEMPPNYGASYTEAFRNMYRVLAAKQDVPLLPFLLEPIARDRAAFQSDNLHPVAAAQPRLLEHVWTMLNSLTAPPPAP